jgi:enoyl-CoA hydratase
VLNDVIAVSRSGATATVTLHRPARRNALRTQDLELLATTVRELGDDEDVHVIVLQGSAEVFSAGADITELAALTSGDAARAHARAGQAACDALERTPVVVIAAIDGWCVGGGLELALSCDVRLASSRARFGQVELGIASIAAWGGVRRLPRIVGIARAKELVFTAAHIDAERALHIGLVTAVSDDLDALVAEYCSGLVKHAPQALATAKRALDHAFDVPLKAGLEADLETFALLSQGDEFRAGVARFLAR